jgi:dihydrofolate reductase
MKELYLIAAMAENRVIGADGKIPWNIPAELQLFKKLTTGNIIVMGRKTYESIGRPLPDRQNIVIKSGKIDGVTTCGSILEAVRIGEQSEKKLFFIGGADIYASTINIVSHMYISWIKGKFKGDTYFPDIDFTRWRESEKVFNDEFTMVHYLRSQSSS